MGTANPPATKRALPASHRPVRVAIVNDYEVIVAGVAAMLERYNDRVNVVELDVQHDPDHTVDVALFDTYGQVEPGLARLRSLAATPTVHTVVVYTWNMTDAGRRAALDAGARGLLAKALPAVELVEALEAVFSGEVVETGGFRGSSTGAWPGSRWDLSARESETLALLTTGMTNRSIADALFVSENTVRTHLKAVFRKLGVENRSQAVARALNDPNFAARRSPT